jgi:hypothetical protein
MRSKLYQLCQYGAIGVLTIGASILVVQSVPSLADILPFDGKPVVKLNTQWANPSTMPTLPH